MSKEKERYNALLEKYMKITEEEVNKNYVEKIYAKEKVRRNLRCLGWQVKIAARRVNELYSVKIKDFCEECEKEGLEVRYPLALLPKELLELQSKLDQVGDEIKELSRAFTTHRQHEL